MEIELYGNSREGIETIEFNKVKRIHREFVQDKTYENGYKSVLVIETDLGVTKLDYDYEDLLKGEYEILLNQLEEIRFEKNKAIKEKLIQKVDKMLDSLNEKEYIVLNSNFTTEEKEWNEAGFVHFTLNFEMSGEKKFEIGEDVREEGCHR